MRSDRLKVLLIDHRDSFTCNIKAWLESRFEVSVRLYSEVNDADIKNFNMVVVSPGPNSPQDYPHTLQLLKNLGSNQPVLGICLGMQMMNVVEGGTVHPYAPPLHGKTSLLQSKISFLHDLKVARYHSLECRISENFETLATSDGIAMITKHKNKNWLAFQFHPESFMTENGSEFLNYAVSELLQGSV